MYLLVTHKILLYEKVRLFTQYMLRCEVHIKAYGDFRLV
jgi:hypothetical protein